MSSLKAPFRHDYVGSFLRPTSLKKARADFQAGKITQDELTSVEDAEITRLVEKIKELGYHVITDGEFRRQSWHLDFMWSFDGVGHQVTETGLPFHGEQAMIDDTYLTGKVRLTGEHPFVSHFRFVRQFEDENTVAKQTIPSPAQFLEQFAMPFSLENTSRHYPDISELVDDIVVGYQEVIRQLYAAGCRNLQLDDCTWTMIVDPSAEQFFGAGDDGFAELQERLVDINNRVVASKPDDLVVTTHVCHGNYHSTYASSGPYDAIAPVLFGKERVDAFYLEFDDERSGGFEPLAYVPDTASVVLGLITTKSPELEVKAEVIERVRQAERYVPLDRLCLSPQCGFASCEIGNKLTEEEQWAKLALVKEIADEVWG